MRNSTINFKDIKRAEDVLGIYGCRQRLTKAVGVASASLLMSAYAAIKRAGIAATKADDAMRGLLRAWEAPAPETPEKEAGDVLFLVAYKAFPLSDGRVVPNGTTIKYSVGEDEYFLNKSQGDNISDILKCYNNTKNEEVRRKFEYVVNGHTFENYITSLFENREFFKNSPVFKALRSSGEVEWVEYNPFAGLNEEQVALLKEQRNDFELRHWGSAVIEAIKEIRPLMKAEPIRAIELIKLVGEQLGDMTKLDIHQKRCSEWVEDPFCGDNSWELDQVKREVRVSPKEREYRWLIKSLVANMARDEGAEVVLKWVNKWAPTETSKKPNIKGESFKIARAIGYKEACDLFFQTHFDNWREELVGFLGHNSEAENAYMASLKVEEALGSGETLAEALSSSTYDIFLDGVELLNNSELDVKIVENWLNSTNLSKFDKIMEKIKASYKEAKILQYETHQIELLGELREARRLEKGGLKINPDFYRSLRKQHIAISRQLETLRGEGCR